MTAFGIVRHVVCVSAECERVSVCKELFRRGSAYGDSAYVQSEGSMSLAKKLAVHEEERECVSENGEGQKEGRR